MDFKRKAEWHEDTESDHTESDESSSDEEDQDDPFVEALDDLLVLLEEANALVEFLKLTTGKDISCPGDSMLSLIESTQKLLKTLLSITTTKTPQPTLVGSGDSTLKTLH